VPQRDLLVPLRSPFFASGHADAAAAGFDDSFIYEQLETPLPKRSLPSHQIMQQPSLKAFQAWLSHEQRIHY
jgi:guanine deaminase